MIRVRFASLAAAAALMAGCSSDPNAASNQIWPIPQLDAAFGSPHSPPPPPEPLDAHRPGYLPAYPSYQALLTEPGPPGQEAPTAAQPPAEGQALGGVAAKEQSPTAGEASGGLSAEDQRPATGQALGGMPAEEPPADVPQADVNPPYRPQTLGAVGGGSSYVR